jgi:Mg-chelatase subunit ChlD
MIFESLLPLLLLIAVPIVVIFYLLVPKGKDFRISSNILWEKLFKNRQSKTFLEKFIHNLLMYLQIFIILVLIFALMSPYIKSRGNTGGSVVFVLDTSGSMQHENEDGTTRLDEAKEEIKGYLDSAENGTFSLVTTSAAGTDLLAVGSADAQSIVRILDQVECTDADGNLSDAVGTVQSLEAESVIVFTDGVGAATASDLEQLDGASICVVGGECQNVANTFLTCSEASDSSETDDADGLDIAAGLTNYSDFDVSLEIGLYDSEGLISVRSVTVSAGESYTCLFENIESESNVFHTEISNISFDGSDKKDSLSADNICYGIAEESETVDAILVGDGNTYIEKAYLAATGQNLSKTADTDGLKDNGDEVIIYDAGTFSEDADRESSMIFFDKRDSSGSIKNVSLTVADTDITSGINSFSFGVNETFTYDVPVWATGFLYSGDECAGYYGENDGKRQVVLGFDLRESDFALQAEFPVFMSEAIRYLGDSSLLSKNVYEAGESVLFGPQADFDVSTIETDTDKAGVYTAEAGEKSENYVVRFAASSQSDGRITATGSEVSVSYRQGIVKKQLRTALLIISLILLIIEWIIYVKQMRYRGKFYYAVRIVCVLAVLLAIFGISLPKTGGADTTIFLVDLSDSNVSNQEAMEEWLKDCIDKMPAKNQYGIVAFGKTAVVEDFLTSEKSFSHIMSAPDTTATNLEEAVSRGLSMIPENASGRLVILTDGRQTKGNIASTATAVTTRGVELLSMLYENEQDDDAYIEDVKLPSYLYAGDSYSVTVTVESNYETDGELLIWTGNRQTGTTEVHLNKGSNRFVIKQKVTGETEESFKVIIAASGDTCEENNSYSAYAVIDSLPKVLVVKGLKENGGAFSSTLEAAGINYSEVSAGKAPDTLEEMLSYRSIILENVYRTDLPEGFLLNVETYVKDYGCGLICCGGKESFALGGYRDTELETVLPVDMELRGVNELPTLAMVMVIDHSGSMSDDTGVSKLDLAIAAADAAVDELRDTDYVGVLTFDDTFTWQVTPVLASDKDAIHAKIRNIEEGGGTTIKPALNEALNKIKNIDADTKHVVLLTDGQGETSFYGDVMNSYEDAGVTLSTVAVGEDADTTILENLADACGGRYYYSDYAQDIPKIFAQEVFLSGDTYLQNGNFALAVNGNNEITKGLYADGYPAILGYVSATPKSGASVLIATAEKDDPILSVMQYGLGHTVAWNTDVNNEWSGPLAKEDDYAGLWKHIIDYSAGNGSIGEDDVSVETANGSTKVTYRAKDYTEQTSVEALYTDPDGNTDTVKLSASAPGVYESDLDTDITGIYNLSVRRTENGEIENSLTTAAVVQYSDEYKFALKSDDYTAFIKQYGEAITSGDNIWGKLKSNAASRLSLTKWLILFAIIWFVMDIGFRRFCYVPPVPKFGKIRKEGKKQEELTEAVEEDVSQAVQKTKSEAEIKSDKPPKHQKPKQQDKISNLDTAALLNKKKRR